MDISVIKEQLGNFKTFVDSINTLIGNFPKALGSFGGLVTGEIKPFGNTAEYNESLANYSNDLKNINLTSK